MGTVRSGASRSRLSWSCRRAVRPIVRASVAAAEGGARIWDANLGFGACAAQEFRLVDDRDAERLGLLELGPRVGAHDEGGGLLRDAVRDVAARRLDQLGCFRPGERRQGAGHDIRLSRQRALPLGDGRDRKSTRLNSSHEWISYAVFCLKKKKNKNNKKQKTTK